MVASEENRGDRKKKIKKRWVIIPAVIVLIVLFLLNAQFVAYWLGYFIGSIVAFFQGIFI